MSDVTADLIRPAAARRAARQWPIRYSLLFILFAVVVIFSVLRPDFATAGNIEKILLSSSISAIMFLGVTWVVAAGEIDISFMEVAALSDMIVAGLVHAGYGWPLAACLGIIAGLCVGIVNGLLIGFARLPGLITTLATGGFARSMAAVIGAGSSLEIGSTGFVGRFINTSLGFLPAAAILAICLYALAWFVQERLVFGHYVYAAEQNRNAVVEAGIPARRLILTLYIVSALAASIAGVLLTANLASGQPRIGSSFFIDGLTAVLLGGMVIKFGQPNVLGSLIAVVLLAVLVSGTALLGWPDWQRDIIKGVLLLLGVVIVVRGRTLSAHDAPSGAH